MKQILAYTILIAGSAMAGCGGNEDTASTTPNTVVSSGKAETALADVPPDVIAAAMAIRPAMDVSEAEYETRDGREYYDVGGTLADGSEVELDMTRVDGAWTVVEIQRDIDADALPAPVAAELASAVPGWSATRIIESEQVESDQGEGTVIYEFFGLDATGGSIKHEVRWADGKAELLKEEWVH